MTPSTEIYTLSLHDALPISLERMAEFDAVVAADVRQRVLDLESSRAVVEAASDAFGSAAECVRSGLDRKSTRLNSSHSQNSYAVFCLKKEKNHEGLQLPLRT